MERENTYIPEERQAYNIPYIFYNGSQLESAKVDAPSKYCPEKVIQGSCYFPPYNELVETSPPKSKSEAVISPSKFKGVTRYQYKLKINSELRAGLERITKVFSEAPVSSLCSKVLNPHPTGKKTVLLAIEDVICHVISQSEKGSLKCASTALTGLYNKFRVIKRPYLDVLLSILSTECDVMVIW
jgi:hypothetical protein